jgi:hypothetical protein
MTKVFIDTYKGNKIFAVWNVDENGNKTGQYPVVSFGAKKAIGLMQHLDELNAFAAATSSEIKKPVSEIKVPTDIKDVF